MSNQTICKNEIAAGRWAKSLLELSYDEGLNKETVLNQLIEVVDTVNASEDLKELFINPVVTVEEKQNVIEKIFGTVLSQTVKNFLLVLAMRKRLNLLEAILEEYKKEFSKRPCVEGPFGIFKEQYHVNQEIVIGMVKTEERLNLDAVAYNIKRLYNLIQGEQNNKEDIIDFCESISTTHQLKLDVNIY